MDPVSSIDAQLAGLAEALRERRRVIADREFYVRDPAGHLAHLQRVSVEISKKAADLPAPAPPQLAHFLERCSYDKALAWIETADRGT